MDVEDLKYIQDTINWINDNSQLIDVNSANTTTLCNRVLNSQALLDRAIARERELNNENS